MTFPQILKGAAALLILSAGFALPAASEPVARVNGMDITEEEVAFAEAEVGAEIAGLPEESRRRVLVEYLVEAHLFAEAAEKAKLNEGKAFADRLEYYKLRALRDAFYETKIRDAVTDEQAKAIYDEQVAKLTPEDEVRARHILVKTEEEAKQLLEEIKKGADFVELAQKSSDGPSAQSGGDLGYFSRGQMVKSFEDAAFALEKGQVSEPVQTEFGWHIIKLEDKRKRPLPTFEEVKDQLVASLIQNKLRATVQDLRASANIEIVDPELKKAIEEEEQFSVEEEQEGDGAPAENAEKKQE